MFRFTRLIAIMVVVLSFLLVGCARHDNAVYNDNGEMVTEPHGGENPHPVPDSE